MKKAIYLIIFLLCATVFTSCESLPEDAAVHNNDLDIDSIISNLKENGVPVDDLTDYINGLISYGADKDLPHVTQEIIKDPVVDSLANSKRENTFTYYNDEERGEKNIYGKFPTEYSTIGTRIYSRENMADSDTYVFGYTDINDLDDFQILCHDKNCDHLSTSCIAYAGDDTEERYYYKITADGYDKQEEPVLYVYMNGMIERIDEAAQTRAIVSNNIDYIRTFMTYGDYIYYVIDSHIYKQHKAGGDPEIIPVDIDGKVRLLDITDDYLIIGIKDDNEHIFKLNLDKYDLKKLADVEEGYWIDYVVDNIAIIRDGVNCYKIDLESKLRKLEKIADNVGFMLTANGKIYYFTNEAENDDGKFLVSADLDTGKLTVLSNAADESAEYEYYGDDFISFIQNGINGLERIICK